MAMTRCKECGHSISTTADACPSCGAKQIRTSGCAKVVLVVILVFTGFALLGQCTADPPRPAAPVSSPPNLDDAAKPAAESTPPPPVPESTVGDQWRYIQSDDPMSGKTSYSASVRSTNTVSFGFPYSGAQRATLTLRTHPRHGRDLIFAIERGQLLCRSYDGCTVLARFDDRQAIRYSAIGPSDNSTEVLFIRNYSGFAGEMLKAERVRISVEVYQQGSPVFEFDVSGFDVNRYRPGG